VRRGGRRQFEGNKGGIGDFSFSLSVKCVCATALTVEVFHALQKWSATVRSVVCK
jgi:hypothetical protein